MKLTRAHFVGILIGISLSIAARMLIDVVVIAARWYTNAEICAQAVVEARKE